MKKVLLPVMALMLSAVPAWADSDNVPVIKDRVVKQECGDCHIAFQPQLLPKASWQRIMSDLPNHFGEDASLEKDIEKHIETYLVENAADAGTFSRFWRSSRFDNVKGDNPSLRITQTSHWVHEHEEEDEITPQRWAKAKSKANCQACHNEADKGYYDD
ncbi:diheme cytochrome c [Candidatus Terasakiella magnetica]|nr:diheme cytochrome c [Candidatus Terasakiella magnetica]